MKAILQILALAAMGSIAMGAMALPQAKKSESSQPAPAKKQKFFYHYEWSRGAVVTAQEWKRGATIAHPRREGLPRPPAGEQWREIDRNYVLVSSKSHRIVRVMAAPHPTAPGYSGGEP
jgi:Ni/Co efflux regulator RcnB